MSIPDAACAVENCEQPAKQRGWCMAHYKRWWRHGDPLEGRTTPRLFDTELEAFGFYTEPGAGCWLWTGPSRDGRYGTIRCKGVVIPAHRWAYEHFVGPIPPGLEPDHLCRNTFCVNPDHLEIVTPRENVRRSESPPGINARKTHCIHGHEFTPENTQTWHGKRQCRTCKREQENERRKVNGRTS